MELGLDWRNRLHTGMLERTTTTFYGEWQCLVANFHIYVYHAPGDDATHVP